jgi:endonuclease/exonuclease/phosphatase family metal-dependent hydrolase
MKLYSICALIFGLVLITPLEISYSQTQAEDVVLYASQAPVTAGAWQVVSDSTAAGGRCIADINLGLPKLFWALPNPANYFEMSFYAQAGTGYRLWIRGKAEGDSYSNDSVHVQFSGSVDSDGSPRYRIGTFSATTIVLEDCLGCGLSQWAWQDNGWGSGVMGPLIYFESTGTQTIRIQSREDGLSIDQIVLSPGTYLNSSPGALLNDTTILPPTPTQGYSVTASPSTVSPGHAITVTWTAANGRPANDWIGLHKVGDPETNYISWQYTQGAPSGTMTFTAPSPEGQYEFRYFTNNGYTKVATSDIVSVSEASATYSLSASPSTANAGDTLTATWTAPSGRPANDWIGLFKVSDPETSFISWKQTGGTSSGSITFPAPSQAGQYEFRYFTSNSYTRIATSNTVTITTPPPPANGTPLKVMSFNIEFGEGTDGIYNLDRTATWIANMNPDIIALCQVNRYAYDDQAVRLTTLMGQKTGVTWYFHWKEKYPGDYEGQMILSKYPFVSTSSLYLSYQMSVAQATINVGGRNINFFSAHLDWIYPLWREVQALQLNTWAATFAEPRIIAGDFNAWPDQASISIMNTFNYDAWTEALNNGTAAAYPDNPVGTGTRTRKGRIDYVFYSRGATSYLEVTGAQIPDSRDLSNPNVVRRVGTLDDLGVRPSEHNIVIAKFLVK